MTPLYDTLLQLPLFLGMSRNEVTDLVGFAKLGFHKRAAGEPITHEHEACRSLVYLLSGEMSAQKSSDRHDYTITERFAAPMLIEPERLFGLYQHYARTYTALTDCRLLTIQKPDVFALCQSHNIFLINLLGLTSTAAQKLGAKPWHDVQQDRERRLLDFLSERMLTPKGEKQITANMQTLADATGVCRLHISSILNGWHEQGLISLSRRTILIPQFERLSMQKNIPAQ